jgi:3-hydroxyacyl-CoA dehydrogenase/enoyl-CoA hydratase/3-hydroxybutyryl-CoA epimerase
MFPPIEDPSSVSLTDLEERMLVLEALEAVKCYDEGVIESVADANIGSILGIGFPGWSGGALQYINGYQPEDAGTAHTGEPERRAGGTPAGLTGFVARCRELADRYGERFEPPASLVAKAERGEMYTDEPTLVTTG